ncbi:MAG: cytochrome P450, partial [Acidimicrobiales bacterium]
LYTLLTDTPLEGRVRADPSLVPGLVEESLRVSPPVLFIPVGCVRETTVGETGVAAGERVILGTASANRDETVFEEADTFDVERANADKHLTFGFGPHLCIGAELARTTARIALEELFGTFPEGALTLDPSYSFENVSTYFECGPARLPVAVAPSPRQEGAL